MLPQNKYNYCEKILESGAFISRKNYRKESIWLIKYMKLNGYSDEEIYEKWIKMYCDASGDDEGSLAVNTFARLKSAADACQLGKPKTYFIYEEEIAEINSVFLPIWAKRFIFVLYCLRKIAEKDWFNEDTMFYKKEICKFVGKQRVRLEESEFLLQRLVESSLIYEKSETVVSDYDGEEYKTIWWEFAFARKSGTVAFTYKNLYDIEDKLDLINNNRVCSCGTVYEKKSADMVRCPVCQRKKEKNRLSQFMSQFKKPEEQTVCERCGEPIIVDGNSKDALCEKCKKEKENKRLYEFMSQFKKPEETCNCVSCGALITIDGNSKTIMCDACWKKGRNHKKNYNKDGSKRSHHKVK